MLNLLPKHLPFVLNNLKVGFDKKLQPGLLMNIFRQLRWKLTLSYTLVTVSAFVVATLVVGGIVFTPLFVPNSYFTPEELLESLRENINPTWSHILSQTPVDTELIKFLATDSTTTITSRDLLRIGDVQFYARTIASLRYLIVGADGTLLGKYDQHFFPKSQIGKPLDTSQLVGLDAPLKAALAGETDLEQLVTIFEPNNRFLMAVPIVNRSPGKDAQVVGVIAVLFESFPTRSNVPLQILNLTGKSLIYFLIGTAIMGSVFGAMNAKGMDVRFKRLSNAADAWSTGDFTKFIEDDTGDEITQFSNRLNNMAKQLHSLLYRRQELAVSEERNRLARDLHDSAKQQALAASFQLGTALALYERDPQSAKEHLAAADNLVDSVRKELTNLVHELRFEPIEGQDFSGFLKAYALEWSQRSGIDLNINMDGQDNLLLETREILFRIAQEALANIARHSSASCAEIYLEYGQNLVILKIKDDGCGFDLRAHHSGLGLYSMRERAEAVNGSFIIESESTRGTQIVVTLPNGS